VQSSAAQFINLFWRFGQSRRRMRLLRLFPSSGFGFAARVAALYAAIFAAVGVQQPFFPYWLKAKGLDPQMIGIVLAVPMLVRIVAIPVASRIADRTDALRSVMLCCAVATVVGYVLLGVSQGAVAILAVFALASAAYTPVIPLSETYSLRGLAARGRVYGPVRLWGSAAFIVGTFVAGVAADIFAARNLIWLIAAAIALNVVAVYTLEPLPPAPPHPADAPPRRHLMRDPAFVAVLGAAGLIQASHALYYGFSTLQWSRGGLDGATIAALWALGVAAEIVLFGLQGRFLFLRAPATLLLIGGCGALLRWSAMAFDPPVLMLPFLQLLHGLSFGATHLGTLGFVSRHAPPGQGATAQGYVAIALGLAMAASMSLSGLLYASYGSLAYAAMALAAVAGCACALVARYLRRDVAV
jgi:PPP family 3-phenylpropionic acid transporter